MFFFLAVTYLETGWETLAEKKKDKEINIDVKNNKQRITGLFNRNVTNTIGDTNRHNLRDSLDFVIPFQDYVNSNIILSINFKIMEWAQ